MLYEMELLSSSPTENINNEVRVKFLYDNTHYNSCNCEESFTHIIRNLANFQPSNCTKPDSQSRRRGKGTGRESRETHKRSVTFPVTGWSWVGTCRLWSNHKHPRSERDGKEAEKEAKSRNRNKVKPNDWMQTSRTCMMNVRGRGQLVVIYDRLMWQGYNYHIKPQPFKALPLLNKLIIIFDIA